METISNLETHFRSFDHHVRPTRALVALPPDDDTHTDWIENEAHWTEWTDKLSNRKGKIILPKLESTYGKTLNDVLKAMGMAEAFDPDGADFSRIHPIPPLCLLKIPSGTQFGTAGSIASELARDVTRAVVASRGGDRLDCVLIAGGKYHDIDFLVLCQQLNRAEPQARWVLAINIGLFPVLRIEFPVTAKKFPVRPK